MRRLFSLAFILLCSATGAFAAGSVSVQTNATDGEVAVNQPVTITLTVSDAQVSEVKLPYVDGLVQNSSGTNLQSGHEDFTFLVTPSRAGDFTIPGFDLLSDDGQTLHVPPIKLHAK